MAKVKKKAVLEGLRGQVGELVFRQYGDRTVVSQRPVHNPRRVPTSEEAAQQARIKEAATRAKAILATGAGRAYYKAARQRLGKHSAYHATIHDYFGVPEVLAVDWQAGALLIQVQDNVGVREVRVLVGSEGGLAEPMEDTPYGLWQYPLAGGGPWVVRVEVEDGMGNVGEWVRDVLNHG
jgi:hypothetical protein